MAVKLRMMRMGRRHRPFFRINAIDSRSPRDGKILEKLGHYDPIEKDPEKQVVLDLQRVQYWLDKGAVPSDAVSYLLLRKGVETTSLQQKTKRRTKARAMARTKGRPFTEADRIAAEKSIQHAEEKAKAEAEEKAKAKAAKEKAKAEPAAETKADEQSVVPEPKAEPEEKPASDKQAENSDEN
jgi:small subunit ribosomal protein S16